MISKQLVAAIIFIILLVFAFVILWYKIAPNLGLGFLNGFIQGSNPTEHVPESIILESAIKCSFYRCVSGCNSDDVKNIKYSSGAYSFDCSNFCKSEFTDTGSIDGKICDDKSKTNPVVAQVVLSNGEQIYMSNLTFANCIMETDGCNFPNGIQKFVYVPKSSVKENTETAITCPARKQGFNSLVVLQGTYKIWTDSYDFVRGGQATYICGS